MAIKAKRRKRPGIRATVRPKPILGNKESLYLDFYPPITNPETGRQTRREFLNMVVFSETEYQEEWYEDKNQKQQRRIVPVLSNTGKAKSRKLTVLEKQHNDNTKDLAEQIRQRREHELNMPLIYSDLERDKLLAKESGKGNFVEYFKTLADKKNGSDKKNWYIVYKYLNDFTGGNLSFNNLNEKWAEEFRSFILDLKSYNSDNSLKQNSCAAYFTKFKTALKQSFKDRMIQEDLSARVSPIKVVETKRIFLTLEELKRLAKADCSYPILKKAALFSALTGLRYSDIRNMIWSNIEIIDDKPVVRFTIQKTKAVETVWISEEAYTLLGMHGQPDEKVFPGFHITSTNSRHLDRWLGEAKISKHITFHSMRHTYSCLQLSLGTSIYTLKSLLGHKSIRSTEVYAKIMDKSRQDAAEKIKLDL